MFKKILVANRGEIALRVIRTCKEMGIQTVAVYSTADAESLHVKFADEAVCIGPALSSESYLKVANIIAAAEITNADAIHPGYGFLSENARFSKICEEHGIKFIGASPEMIDRMGDKANAKATMKAAGVPCVPGSEGVIETFSECKKTAKKTGYPVMLKASAGGGGKGMRAVWKEEDLKDAWDSARQESKAAFGNDDMYMEKLIEEPRHIEIQIIGDSNGKACHLSERDCSIQRRHQKLTEEVPSPFMTDALRKKMGEAAVKAAEFIKYEGAGTVEFLVDKHRNFYFMEMNTRIQVEHPITEQVIDFDLIREQILVASGVAISGKDYFPNLHSIECRINAEDPFNDFRPSPGKITTLHSPGGHGVRLDTHVYAGYIIPPNYDSMIAKLITTAQTREEAIFKMKRALDEFVIEGIKTTIPFHRQLMDHPDYIAGNYTTKFMEDFVIESPN
ncbi:acetyl-CoA carboxylase [Formosa sp. Hel3_A1_48]|jgi:acetyl-CoA carboxylase biotin carboxylase subunit|uniref:acetyl-CoA carboxylase biotin carboxylase subunit n=1 Tax=Formosa sp. Hel3_A1_48 TaxID=1336795 RepID=UPI00084E277C|nr:acetyl-CoA carboxylase biotin carboxylase subunit [Formosa sp. Hel3_A1_48]MDA9761130.1 acetyl-CoA carboxylase biotin carboxylase subunit [Flavobacteriaceae bacterium]AOR26189.1 acetyl-CoA carboxylase [Formosa sp. Hel3_A1_48]MDA9846410.1 acetyl-CoA carboxylase biotin carboxylase subunit [Flavobacteriaceae bacterium]MDC0951079.1 acetyl-CoA carboxylase biotin carboxylase subunit [Flavobacteriaceae bacterium]MDG2484731.1 acetyl-CoA carboxylase biotin carboxylase subunit [Flavobacteriaceae bacte|tara:strand:- start:478 stop:1824 length:1347 start_codon:yes stop_codon:yes gene_type:complete